jgi:hypothetical protein
MAEGEALPRIDHIIIGAQDLRAAVKHFYDEYGLAGYEGGKHQGGWGTENYIIPLGAGYIEIAAVWDPEAAQSCDWGRYIAATPISDKPWKLMTFCVQTKDDAADISKRLDHMLGHMTRLRPDGSKLTWRVATMSRFDEPGRAPKPFFITWDDPSLRPDKFQADHRASPVGVEYIEVAGDKAAMADWIGPGSETLPLRWGEGSPALKSVGIKTADGKTIVLD